MFTRHITDFIASSVISRVSFGLYYRGRIPLLQDLFQGSQVPPHPPPPPTLGSEVPEITFNGTAPAFWLPSLTIVHVCR